LGHYVILTPMIFVFYNPDVLLGRYQAYAILFQKVILLCLFMMAYDWLSLKNPIKKKKSTLIFLVGLGFLVWVVVQVLHYPKFLNRQRAEYQPALTEQIMRQIASKRDLVGQAGTVLLLNFPYIKSFILGTASTSFVRLATGYDVLSISANAKIPEGNSYKWVSDQGIFLSDEPEIQISSHYGYSIEIPMYPEILKKPTLLIYFDQKAGRLLYTFYKRKDFQNAIQMQALPF